MRSAIQSFAVTDQNGNILVETDFPRLHAIREGRAHDRRHLGDYEQRRQHAAAIVAAMERDQRARNAGRHINNIILPPPDPRHRRINAARSAIAVAAAVIWSWWG
jgi:hypothetical protein